MEYYNNIVITVLVYAGAAVSISGATIFLVHRIRAKWRRSKSKVIR